MFRLQPAAIAVAAAAALGACGLPSATADAQKEVEARALVVDLAAGRDEAIAARLASNVNPAEFRAQLPFLKSMVPAGPVPEGSTVGWSANVSTGGSTYVVNRTYDYPDRMLAVETVFVKQGETWKIGGFHLMPTMKATAPAAEAPAEKAATVAGTSPHSG